MPNCDFYALGPDSSELVHFIFSQPGWLLCERMSEPDHPLRELSTERAFHAAFDVSAETIHLQLHAPAMRGRIHSRRIALKPGAIPGASFRHGSHGWGLIQLYLVAPRDGRLGASHTNHNSEKRARLWEPTYADEADRADDWDWAAVTSTSSRLNRFIRSRALSRLGSRPVLPAAHDAAAGGLIELQLAP